MRVIIAKEAGVRRERLRQAVLGIGLECGAGDCVAYGELPGRLLHAPADVVLVGLGAEPQAALPIIRHAADQTQVPVFAVGVAMPAEQILQTIRSGAREYLHEEVVCDELVAALGKLRQANGTALNWGEILAVIGAKPGSGVTTVASNLAFALAGPHPGRVVLAELGAGVPELALDLDLQPTHSLADLAAGCDRLDATLLRQALVGHPARLSVLAHAPGTLLAPHLKPPVVRQILVLLRTMFDYAVLDLGHTADAAQREALDLAHKVAVVFGLDVPSLRLTRRLLHQLDEWGVPRPKLHLVANRYGQRKQCSWKRAQEALGLPIQEWIPDDSARINQALNLGQPIVQLSWSAGIGRSFKRLAGQLNGRVHGRDQGRAG